MSSSNDGAMQGVSAHDALRVILGGESEDDIVHAYDTDFESTIRNAQGPPWDYLSEDGYSACANWLAHCILEWLEADQSRILGPVEDVIEWYKNEDGSNNWSQKPKILEKGWDTLMKEVGYFPEPDRMYGCTGFQWGWACNAARKIVGLDAIPNPAIMTIGGSDGN